MEGRKEKCPFKSLSFISFRDLEKTYDPVAACLSCRSLLDPFLHGSIPDRISLKVTPSSYFRTGEEHKLVNFCSVCVCVYLTLITRGLHVSFNSPSNWHAAPACTFESNLHIMDGEFDPKHLVVYQQLTSLHNVILTYCYWYILIINNLSYGIHSN